MDTFSHSRILTSFLGLAYVDDSIWAGFALWASAMCAEGEHYALMASKLLSAFQLQVVGTCGSSQSALSTTHVSVPVLPHGRDLPIRLKSLNINAVDAVILGGLANVGREPYRMIFSFPHVEPHDERCLLHLVLFVYT